MAEKLHEEEIMSHNFPCSIITVNPHLLYRQNYTRWDIYVVINCLTAHTGEALHLPPFLLHWGRRSPGDPWTSYQPQRHPNSPQEAVCWHPFGGVWRRGGRDKDCSYEVSRG